MQTKEWWKEAVIYQIFPKSFKDSNDDGKGDIKGIISKLGYLVDLGVNILWLTPICKSSGIDEGYDISDFRSFEDFFGTHEDWKELMDQAHSHGMKIMMDIVLNHTSDEHPWFLESKKSKDNPYRDYYFWKKGKDGKEPTNWEATFGGSVWEYDETTDEYYFHLFHRKQPDLNWDNPKVRNEMFEVLEFWIKTGVDAFRLDAINALSKDLPWKDAPINSPDSKYQVCYDLVYNGPHLVERLAELKQKVTSVHNIFTMGEIGNAKSMKGADYTSHESGVMDFLIHFELIDLDSIPDSPYGKWALNPNWKLSQFKAVMSRWYCELEKVGGWQGLYLQSHDQPRPVTRYGNTSTPHLRVLSAKMLALWLHMHVGTPIIYQGEEISMTNFPFSDDLSDYRDNETLDTYKLQKDLRDRKELLEALRFKSRDNSRTPFQWSGTEKEAGFTGGKPWIKVNPNYTEINAESQVNDKNSVFCFYKSLLRLRKEHSVVVYGSFRLLDIGGESVYSFIRVYDNDVLLVIVNFYEPKTWFKVRRNDLREIEGKKRQLLLSNYDDEPELEDKGDEEILFSFELRPYEAMIYRYWK